LDGVEVFPAHTDRGRRTDGSSEFNVKRTPKNHGVLLWRKLDYAFPNQRAEVFVANVESGQAGEWKSAGFWYLAGSNTCIYSNPNEELGATRHEVQTANRRFRDDEFLIPSDRTEGRSAIRVRMEFTPVELPLFPGGSAARTRMERVRLLCVLLGAAGVSMTNAVDPQLRCASTTATGAISNCPSKLVLAQS
jgi:hypothetical protein